jgi:hypothetical protein
MIIDVRSKESVYITINGVTYYIDDSTDEQIVELYKGEAMIKYIPDTYAEGGEIDAKIKDWYTKNYPTDDLGEEINSSNTFEDLWDGLLNGVDIYDVMGVGDSLVRERLFENLAKVKGVKYNYIYNKWLYPSATDNEIKSTYAEDVEIKTIP